MDEEVAQVKIASRWRGYFVRHLMSAHTEGTPENQKVQESLTKIAEALEVQSESVGLSLLK